MAWITCWVAPCSAGCWCCMDNAVQPMNDQETFVVAENQVIQDYSQTMTIPEVNPVSVEATESNVIEKQSDVKEDNRPNSATSTTSAKIMETNADELLDQTLQ